MEFNNLPGGESLLPPASDIPLHAPDLGQSAMQGATEMPDPWRQAPDMTAPVDRVPSTHSLDIGPQPSDLPISEEADSPGHVPNYKELNEGQPHTVSRTEVNARLIEIAQAEQDVETVERAAVPDSKVSWDVEYPEYDPPFVDVPRGNTSFRKEGDDPHPDDPNEVESFPSIEVPEVQRDEQGYPLNPSGRTGLRGRGMLDKWGPTQAADPILTRDNPETDTLEALLIKRGDTGEWALPGGKVDEGETPAQAAGRELVEEAGVRGVELDFSEARTVYAGYVDDSHNTDNAWMETTALHHHLTAEQAAAITIEAGSDAEAARWVPVRDDLYPTLFASHGQYLRRAVGHTETA